MINFYKYLPTSSEDEKWGLCILNAGYNIIDKYADYPSRQHPSHHYFHWEKGRILDEYQLIYISKGQGVFQSASCTEMKVREGSILVLFPGEWHRFKPDNKTGWEEFWVGFRGDIIDRLVQNRFFDRQNVLLDIGPNEYTVHLFCLVIDNAKEEKTGYQALISGIVLHLLGHIHSLLKQYRFKKETNTEHIINKARVILRKNIDREIEMEKVAEELNVSYSWFRKAFREYTGIAPNQYLLQLRIEQARLLLSDPDKSLKEIALRLNFVSPYYFSKLFKEKTGLSPAQFRLKDKRLLNKN
jgi:AraC-like DNA-binding protein